MTEGVQRGCDDCGLCCKLIGVRELEKAPHVWCRYYRKAHGCSVYADRPEGCAQFACDWLLDERLGEDWRPDRAGFVLHTGEGGALLNVDVDPADPTAWRREPYQSELRLWASRGLDVRIWIARRCLRLTPAGEQDMGVQRPEVTFTTGGRMRRKGSGIDWPSDGS